MPLHYVWIESLHWVCVCCSCSDVVVEDVEKHSKDGGDKDEAKNKQTEVKENQTDWGGGLKKLSNESGWKSEVSQIVYLVV